MEVFAFRHLAKLVQPVVLIAAAFAFFAPATGQAADPGKDHPLVGRYEGSVMTLYRKPIYDEASLIMGPIQGNDPTFYRVKVEGNVSFYYYDIPRGRSSLEVLRNYESGLKAKGFDIVFSCTTSDASCAVGAGDFLRTLVDAATRWQDDKGVCGHVTSSRYMLGKREAGSDTTYAGIYICETPQVIGARVIVVESKTMDTGKIKFIDASEMQKAIVDTGRVNLYGIHFDFDKDEIKPDSQPTIDEMIKLMRANPQMKLQVVGHTDAQGLEPHNNDLSNRRAGSVTRALVQAGIEAGRLSSRGAGSSQPVATNDTEDGRAKNRRVELVGM